jgi:hypothetical protein
MIRGEIDWSLRNQLAAETTEVSLLPGDACQLLLVVSSYPLVFRP